MHDEKFIDAARDVFEEAGPAAHDFLIVGASVPLRYIRTFSPTKMELEAVLEPQLLASLARYSAVFVHYLGDAARLIIDAAPPSVRFIWLAWGADYYHLLRKDEELLLPKTRELVRELEGSTPAARARRAGAALQHVGGVLRATQEPFAAARRLWQRRTLHRIGPTAPGELAVLNRFHAVAMPIEEDFKAVRASHPQLRTPFLDWNYWVDGFHTDQGPRWPSGHNILLGNSATPANNHLDAFEVLTSLPLGARKVICPLSYGDQRYADAVDEVGRERLGDRFVPLREYMPAAAYAEVMYSCSLVVMNHLRQQALGNIILALSAGARVFLHPANPICRTLRRLGLPVHELGQLPEFLREDAPIPEAMLDDVRSRLESHYGRTSILARTRSLLRRLAAAEAV